MFPLDQIFEFAYAFVFTWQLASFPTFSPIGNGRSFIDTLSHTVTGHNLCSSGSDRFTPQTVLQSEVGQPVTLYKVTTCSVNDVGGEKITVKGYQFQ